jgi:hypothetical protein
MDVYSVVPVPQSQKILAYRESRCVVPCYWIEVGGRVHASGTLPLKEKYFCLLLRGLLGPQRQSGHDPVRNQTPAILLLANHFSK